jgi:hypothetical protein
MFFKETLRTTTPLVNQILLTWLVNSYIYVRLTDEERQAFNIGKPQGIGYGIGLAFALFAMQGSTALFMTLSAAYYVLRSLPQSRLAWYVTVPSTNVLLAYELALQLTNHSYQRKVLSIVMLLY